MVRALRLSNPWWIVFGSVMALAVSYGTVAACMGLFMKPFQAEFGWDRATISGAKGLSSLLAAFALTAFGWMIDRWGVRRVVIPAVLAFGTSIGLMSLTQSVASLVAFQLMVAMAGSGHSPTGFVKSISSYIDSRRGLATGIAVAGTGLGHTMVPQYTQWIITHYGWRAGFVGLGALILAVGLPAVILFVRDPDGGGGKANALGEKAALPGLTLGEALKTRSFWTIAAVVSVTAPAVNGALIHIVPMLTDRGIAPAVAASAFVAYGLATIFGRTAGGWAFDRWFAPHILAPTLLLAAGGLFLLRTSGFTVVGVAFLGIAAGAQLNMIAYLVSRYLGLRKQAQLSSFLYAVFALGLATGEFGYGLIYTLFQSYDAAIFTASGLLTVAACLILTLGSYNYAPAKDRARVAAPKVGKAEPP